MITKMLYIIPVILVLALVTSSPVSAHSNLSSWLQELGASDPGTRSHGFSSLIESTSPPQNTSIAQMLQAVLAANFGQADQIKLALFAALNSENVFVQQSDCWLGIRVRRD
jgi:hypothetical protein